jgi:membrane peptidoglycan carboxypeptidase
MGNGQYGFATAAQYYFARPLARFTAHDADKAALLAGIAKAPRYYAPSPKDRSECCAAEIKPYGSGTKIPTY